MSVFKLTYSFPGIIDNKH